MNTLDTRLETMLLAIVRAYQTDVGGSRQPLTYFLSFANGDTLEHDAWPEDGPVIGREDLDELAELGLVRLEDIGGAFTIRPSREALDSVAQYERERGRLERGEAVDTSWASVRPVLHTLVDLWERHGASPSGSVSITAVARELDRPADDLALIRALELLDEDGWIAADYGSGSDGPMCARPLPKALSGTRGWPGADGQAAGERLITALEELAAQEPDEEKRTKLARMRDFAIDLSSKTLSELGGKMLESAL